MSGYITLLSNKIFQVYGSDVYMLCFTEDLETLTNIESIFLDSNQIHFQSHVADIEMLQRRVNNELNYNKLNSKKQYFMLPNLNNIKELIQAGSDAWGNINSEIVKSISKLKLNF